MPDLISIMSGNVTPKPDEIGKVYSDGSQPASESVLDRLATTVVKEYGERESGIGYELNPLGDSEKYEDVGLSQGVNLLRAQQNGTLEKELANAQSATSKFVRGLEQAIVSEIGLGIPKGVSDLFDAIGQAVNISDGDYTNPVSQYLEKLQNDFKEYTPIYSDPDRNTIADGGLGNMGWWAQNIPSIMSSLTLLVPAAGITKTASLLGKLSKVKRSTQKAVKFLTGSSAPSTMKTAGLMFENGMTAALSRTMENYQEAQGVYKDMKNQIMAMSDEDYSNAVANMNLPEDIDKSDKEAVADYIAHKSATETFVDDYANIGFDIIQLYALRNAWKGLRSARGSAKLDALNKRAIETAGMSSEEIAAYDAAHSGMKGATDWVKNNIIGGYKTIAAEASEGVEEAVNYIAQQEGMHLGNIMLGKDEPSPFDTRFREYVKAPQLWDSAFWGLMGGIAFQGLGSTFNRIQNKIYEGNKKADDKTGEDVESVKKSSWWQLDELPEIKRRKANIENQNIRLNQFMEDIHSIVGDETNPGRDIYNLDKENPVFDDTEEGKLGKEITRQRRINEFANDIVRDAGNNGNIDYLKAYMSSDNVRQAMVNSGIVSENESKQFMEDINNRIDHIEQMFDEEITQLNDVAAEQDLDVPVEYLQIIANNNVQHKLNVEQFDDIKNRLDNEAAKIGLSLTKNGKATDEQLNVYKQLIDLQVKNQELAALRAEVKKIEDTPKIASTLAGQVQLDDLNTRIKAIERQIYDDTNDITLGTSLFVSNVAERATIGKEGNLNVRNSKKAIKQLDDILAGKFDDFLKEIGSNKTSSDFNPEAVRERIAQLGKDIKKISHKKSELDNLNPNLKSLYATLSSIDIARTYEQSKLTSTVDEVKHYANMLNNTMVQSRKDAIEKSYNGLVELNKKYKDISIPDIINNVVNQEQFDEMTKDMSDVDKNSLVDYISILNLTNDSNKELGLEIARRIVNAEREEARAEDTRKEEDGIVDDGTNGENSTISQEPLAEVKPSQTINQSGENAETATRQENALNNGKIEQSGQPQTEMPVTNFVNDLINHPTRTISNVKSYIQNNSLDDILNKIQQSEQKIDDINKDLNDVRQKFAGQNGMEEVTRGPLAQLGVETNNLNQLQLASFILQNDETSIRNSFNEIGINNKDKLNQIIDELIAIKQSTNSPTGGLVANSPSKLSNEEVIDAINAKTVSWFRSKIQSKEDITLDDYNASMQDVFNQAEDEASARKEAVQQYKDFIDIVSSDDEVAGLVKDIVNSESTLDETNSDKFTESYEKATKSLINRFRKDLNIKKVGDKYHISVEDLLRYCNAHANSTAPGHLIYNQMINYLQSGKLSDYIIDDIEQATTSGFINTVDENLIDRINTKRDNQRIGVQYYLDKINNDEEETKATLKELDSIKVGDKLTYDVDDRIINVKHNGVTVGNIVVPVVDNDTQLGQLEGWNYDISHTKGGLNSNFKQAIVDVINSNEQESKNVIEAIRDLGSYRLTEEDKQEIIDRIKDNNVWKSLKHNFSNGTESDLNLAMHLAKVFVYDRNFRSAFEDVNRSNAIATINNWFETIGRSFDEAVYLKSNPNTPINITEASRGEQNYSTAGPRPINDKGTIADKYKGRIRIAMAPMKNTGELIASRSNEVPSIITTGGMNPGSTFAIIPDVNGSPTFVQAYPAKFGDNYINQEVKDIENEIKGVIKDSIKKAIEVSGDRVQAINALQPARNLLIKLLNNWKGNTPLFVGLRIGYEPAKSYVINIFDKGGTNPMDIGIDVHGDFYYRNKGTNYNRSQVTVDKIVDDIFNKIKENTVFNISEDWIKSDNNTSNVIGGVASRTSDGKFQIKIGNNTPHIFDSFNDFIINNNLIKVNTEVGDNGDNFHRVGERGLVGNASLKYARTQPATSRPVERMNTPTDSKYDEVANLLNIDGNGLFDETSGEALASVILKGHSGYKKLISSLTENDLLPNVVKFNNTVEGNAKVNRNNGDVYVGQRWLDKIALGKDGQKQAIRKLVHERLHYLIEKNGETDNIRSQIREIYDAFVASNPKDLNQYIDWNKNPRYWDEDKQTLTDEGIEEFFVESLTASDLAKYLNSVESTKDAKANDVKNETLWQKIMRVLQKLLGVNIKDNTLYAQEFMLFTENISPESTENIVQEDINDKEVLKEDNNETKFDTNIKLDVNEDISSNYDDDFSLLDETTGSLESIIESLPIGTQERFINLVDDGTISIMCS